MTGTTTQDDWKPGDYARFRDLRLRPGLDLLNAVGPLPEGDICDLGCGNGALGDALKARAGGQRLIGVDASAAMLDKARDTRAYDSLISADIAAWQPDTPPALIYSNAALHWLGAHDSLMPRLAAHLRPGGTLAVQVPHQNRAPSHRVWLSLLEEFHPQKAAGLEMPGVLAPVAYEEMLSPLGQFRLWETEYYQRLTAEPGSHPVRRFTEATFARPILRALDADEAADLIRRYEEVMAAAYQVRGDGSVLFPFRRLFFTLAI